MAEIVILGGGFGGLGAAAALAPATRQGHRVLLIERRGEFMMGLRKLWILSGKETREKGARSMEGVRRHGATWLREEIVAIEHGRKRVRTAGSTHAYDFLIVAVGAEPRPDLVSGFEHAVNLYDVADVEQNAVRTSAFAEGRLVVGILGLPYKCPPAPYEAAMLLDARFREKGTRRRVELLTFTPQPMSLPVAGPEACAFLESQLATREIRFEPNRKAVRIEPGKVVFEGGGEQPFDLLLGVPPHRAPRMLKESGLVVSGEWIRPDPATLRTTWEDVFAIGDATEIPLANGMPLPKAGIFAEAQARVAAGHVLHALGLGTEPAPFDGKGYCFVEMGGDRAAYVRGEFMAPGRPRVEISEPDEATFRSKRDFERDRLNAWL